jgi:hydroxymethylglutaryl-CoA reductase (NADPH)
VLSPFGYLRLYYAGTLCHTPGTLGNHKGPSSRSSGRAGTEAVRSLTDAAGPRGAYDRCMNGHPTPTRLPGTAPEAIAERWAQLARPDLQECLSEGSAAQAASYERNVENYIGVARVPLGIAGPLRVNGLAAQGDFRIPLATTEATLVASYHRGMRLIGAGGGCNAAVLEERISRTPAFVLRDLRAAVTFAAWVREIRPALAAAAERTTRYARCVANEANVEGNHVYLDCAYRTGDAAGQNMVTIATAALCDYVNAHAPVEIARYVLEANLSGDKKATARAMTGTRGKRVSADAKLPRQRVIEHLHVEPERLADYWRLATVGALMSGTIGVQGHYANGIAAFAIATGQDAACVAESAVGITRFETDEDGDLYASVTLPNIVVGTVGGGTQLPTQRAALELLSAGRPLSANALAEILAGVALAGELSISAAICANQFAAAHQRLARGKA